MTVKKLLTLEEASKMLTLKVSRLRFEVFHKTIPYYKIGRSVRFAEDDLVLWVMSKKQNPIVEVKKE